MTVTPAPIYQTREQLTFRLGGPQPEQLALQDLIASVPNSATITSIVSLTQAAYDALAAPDSTTLYIIVG